MLKAYTAIAAICVAALLGVLGYMVLTKRDSDPFGPCRTTSVAGGTAAIGGPFTLLDSSGRTVTDKDVLTGPSLVYFGYTFCPDVCPFDMARNAEAIDILTGKGVAVTPVFISVDPERDTPEAVGIWATAMHPATIGLTGTPQQVQAAANAYKVYFSVAAHATGDEYYAVDHTAFTYLMLPGHGFVEFFSRDVTAEQMATSVACFIGKS